MLTLHNLAQSYGRRPSGIIGIIEEWAAYQFDLAVLRFGRWVEHRLAERDSQGHPRYTLAQLLADPSGQPAASERQWMDWRSIARFGGGG